MPYLSALVRCVHDEALYKSTFTFTFTIFYGEMLIFEQVILIIFGLVVAALTSKSNQFISVTNCTKL